jgi:hypothetical protein
VGRGRHGVVLAVHAACLLPGAVGDVVGTGELFPFHLADEPLGDERAELRGVVHDQVGQLLLLDLLLELGLEAIEDGGDLRRDAGLLRERGGDPLGGLRDLGARCPAGPDLQWCLRILLHRRFGGFLLAAADARQHRRRDGHDYTRAS